MMASSTTAPIAIANPPRVIELMVPPSQRRTTMATRSDRGMAIRLIKPARHVVRNSSRTITSSAPPSSIAESMFEIAVSIKSACRNRSVSITTSFGNALRRFESAASTARVVVNVFAHGCLFTIKMTLGFPKVEESPTLYSGPRRTAATC